MYINKTKTCRKITAIFLSIFIICTGSIQANTLTDHQQAVQEKENHKYHKSNYYYFKILSTQPDDISALYGLAHNFQTLGQNDRSLSEVEKLLQIDANHEHGLLLRSLLNIYAQNWNKVLVDAQRVTQINPLNAQAYMYMDTAYSALGNKEEAKLASESYQQLKAAIK